MRVGEIMTREVRTASGSESFTDIARVLHENRISSVVIVEGGQPVGIVTERDIVDLVADGADPGTSPVADRMSTDLATVTSRDEVTHAAQVMADRGIRHLPVIDRGKLTGIVSIRDLTGWAIEEMTGEHELPDLVGSSAALTAVREAKRKT